MIHSRRSLEGYVLIDHRESPGVTAEDVIAAGLDPRTMPIVPGGAVHEAPTISCTHCQKVQLVNPLRTRPRHNCPHCDHYVCDSPMCVLMAEGLIPHRPVRQVMDEVQNAAARGDDVNAILLPKGL